VANRAHPIRDLWLYRRAEDLRRQNKWTKKDAIRAANEEGREKWDWPARSSEGLWSAYKRGERACKDGIPPPQLLRRKSDARAHDAVRNYIMYEAVCEALKVTNSLRRAYRLAEKSLAAEWGPGTHHAKGTSRLRHAYETVCKHLRS
jgi:hypothetical protein